ncbi:MAG: hypothetical protein AAF624_14730 [Bacteroidota bacterium]
MLWVALCLTALSVTSCQDVVDYDYGPYDFSAPTAAFILPPELEEISGLTVLDSTSIGAVQDERGDLFVIDVDSARITHVHDFGKRGDYEAIERVGDRVYVLRSDGRLYVIADWSSEKDEAVELETGLHGSCDAEGLATDDGERLLIVCKESAGEGRRKMRAVFAYDPANRVLALDPVYTIEEAPDDEDAPDDKAGTEDEAGTDEGTEARSAARLGLASVRGFKPAALAVHPRTGRIYVVSSVRKVIVVLEPGGAIHDVWPLPGSFFRQPEGLAFFPDGTLFIANEAAGAQPTLFRFAYTPTP